MRLPIARSLLLALAGLTILVTGLLGAWSLAQEASLVRGLSNQMMVSERALVMASLRDIFDPVRTALSVNLDRFRSGAARQSDTDGLRGLLLPSLARFDFVGSMMVGDLHGYQWLLLKYGDTVVASPLLAGQPNLPALTPGQPQYVTREFHPGVWGLTSHWKIWDATGRQVLSRFTRELPDYDPRKRAWHTAAHARLQALDGAPSDALDAHVVWSDVYELFTTKMPGMSASGAVRDPDGNVVIVAYDVLLEDLSTFTRMRRPTPSAQVFIVTEQGRAIGLPHHDRFADASARRAALLQPLTDVGGPELDAWASQWQVVRDTEVESFSYEVDGASWWGSSQAFALDGAPKLWVGVAIPERELLALAGQKSSLFGWVALGGLAIALALASWIARGISRPIRQIVEQSQRIGNLDLADVRAPKSQIAEVQDLAVALGQMRRALAEYVARLQSSEDRYRSTFELAGIGILHTDPDGSIVFANETIADILGYPRETLIGMQALDVSHPEDQARDRARIADIVAGKATSAVWEKRYVRANGEVIWGQIGVSVMRDASGAPISIIGVIQDVSERKSLEVRLRQSQKLEAVGRLAGGVAHDFNNLLTVIVGYASLAREHLPDDHPVRADMNEIELAVSSASALTRQLLTYARKDVALPRVVDVAEVVRDNEKLMARLIGEHIALQTHIDAGVHAAFIDPVQLQQVLVNLVINARDAMPDGGKLTIGVGRDSSDPGSVAVTVSDNGVGMTDAVMNHIFEPFFTTKEVGQGTGLGLSTCYGIVEEAGGSIDVSSTVGAGSTFTVRLPLRTELPARPLARSASTQTKGNEHILLVEDEPRIRELLHRALARAGFSVVSAADGSEALTLLGGASCDLLITDVVMPSTNGGELAAILRRRQPSLAVLFLSGFSRDVLGDRIPKDVELMTKPFATNDVVRRARDILDRRNAA